METGTSTYFINEWLVELIVAKWNPWRIIVCLFLPPLPWYLVGMSGFCSLPIPLSIIQRHNKFLIHLAHFQGISRYSHATSKGANAPIPWFSQNLSNSFGASHDITDLKKWLFSPHILGYKFSRHCIHPNPQKNWLKI